MPRTFPDVTLDNSFPPGLRHDLLVVAKEVVAVVSKMFEITPPLGWRPITCRFHGNSPRVDVHPDYPHYSIAVNSADKTYAQIADQLGELVGHIFMDPRRTNGFVRTLATAVSLRLFDLLSKRWSESISVTAWGSSIPQLGRYRAEMETKHLKAFPTELREAVVSNRWLDVTRYLRFRHSQEVDHLSEGPLAFLGAKMVVARGVRWPSLVGIASLTTPMPAGEFDWSDSLQPDFDMAKGNVRSLASLLGYRTRTQFAIAECVQKPPSDWGFAFFDEAPHGDSSWKVTYTIGARRKQGWHNSLRRIYRGISQRSSSRCRRRSPRTRWESMDS